MTKRPILIVLTVLALALLALDMIRKQPDGDQKVAQTVDKGGQGEALIGGSVNDLLNQSGQKVSDADFRGKYMLVFFGFTNCPSICPAGLANITGALQQLGDDKNITPVFITIDPERDTPEQMASFLKNFHPGFVGLTGTKEQIKAVEKSFKVYSSKVENQEKPADYMMDHSAFIYLMDKDGKYVTHFTSDKAPELLAKGLKENLK